MDQLKRRLGLADKALSTLQDVLKEPLSPVTRDAAIKRFEYSFETLWKAAQLWLKARDGLELASPKAVVRALGPAGLLAEDEVVLALKMADDRNLTTHTYNEKLALEIFGRLPAYSSLMAKWLRLMTSGEALF